MTWYVVFHGRRPGVYEDWGLCNAQVLGFTHSNYKKFKSAEQAINAYQGFLQATGGMMDDKKPQNECKMFPEKKRMKVFPSKDVVLRLVFVVFLGVLIFYCKKWIELMYSLM